MPYVALYPSSRLYPDTGIWPAIPTRLQTQTYLVGTTGTAVPVLSVTGVDESQSTNTILHDTPEATPLIDLRAWSPPVVTLTLVLPDFATYNYMRDLYRSGATVTLNDPGNPWANWPHTIAGRIGYKTMSRPGKAALLEATIEVIAR